MASTSGVRDLLMERVGFVPKDAFGWLYACRGLYQQKEYQYVVEGLSHCLRNDRTKKQAAHLLAFSLLHTEQREAAAHAFAKSIDLGNETDWQPLIELCVDFPDLDVRKRAD
jgi:hypothetical protein